MADNYLQFSEVVARLKKKEEVWLKKQLQPIRVFANKEYPEDAVPAELADKDADWTGVRFLRDKTDHDPDWDALGFEYSFHDDHDKGGWGRHLWVYAEESGCPDNVAWLVQQFLKKFRPDQCWSLTYSTTCSKPRAGEFGGGAVFVTADAIHWESTYGFIEDQRAAFQRKEVVLAMYVKVEKVFTCPRCGGHRLEEVMHSVIQTSPVLDIEVEDEGEEFEAHIVEYGNATFDGGVVSHYQCLGCGEELDCEPNDQSLYEYLKEMQKGQSFKNEAVASTKPPVKENQR